ncbi:MAG: twin-arginine translocation signal domain-containing protein, partial [Deltaproteobacteria bacterium]|nr:twin-arginine translocation signal domain-containing protein [Deltaproteobacteria bacterium]
MKEEQRVLTRRDFVRAGACLTAGGLMGMPFFGPSPAKAETRSRVVLVRDLDVLNSSGAVRAEVLENML